MKVVTSAEMRAVEEAAGVSTPTLVARAGHELAEFIRVLAPDGPVCILVGPGNNGADGVRAACELSELGHAVSIYAYRREDRGNFRGPWTSSTDDGDPGALAELVGSSAIVVDALLGTGQNRAPSDDLSTILVTVNAQRAIKLAVDVPTGVNADTGTVLNEAFKAGHTLCMGFAKVGDALYPGASYAGELRVASLGLDPALANGVRVHVSDVHEVAGMLPRRSADGNKGASGRMLFVGGSHDFVGAPMLASLAALRSGAGLVEVAVPSSAQPVVAAHALEPVYQSLPEADGKISPAAISLVCERMQKARSVVLGPGMGLSDQTTAFVRAFVLEAAQIRLAGVLLDADGLNALAQIDKWWDPEFPRVVTPHPGEMSRLTQLTIPQVQSDRVSVARSHAERWKSVVVLKGAGTVIASPEGDVAINPTGSANLATAGTGDVLSGIIGSLMAQGLDPYDAARAGVFWHGYAGDMLLTETGDNGLLAGDLLAELPAARISILKERESAS